MTKYQYHFSLGALIFIGLFVAVISYWLLWPYRVLEIKNNPVPVNKKTVMAGDDITYTLDFCRYTDKPAIVTRQFIDGVVYTTPSITVLDKVRCGQRNTLVTVPRTLSADTYHMNVIVQIEVNPIRTVTYSFQTQEFEVLEHND